MITIICAGDFCPQKRVASAISKGDFSCLADIQDTVIRPNSFSIYVEKETLNSSSPYIQEHNRLLPYKSTDY